LAASSRDPPDSDRPATKEKSVPQGKLTAVELSELLANPTPPDATRLAERIQAEVGGTALAQGAPPWESELTVAWAIAVPEAKQPPTVASVDGVSFRLPLTRLGDTHVYAGATVLPEGAAMRWVYDVDAVHRGGGQLEVYRIHPDSREQPDLPKGKVVKQPRWRSKVFDGTVRDWSIYVPAQYRSEEPAAVMVFQDGVHLYQDQVPPVFDNLIARGDMPVTIGLFIDPGTFADTTVSNRSFEYDTLSDQYARFLLEEILPEVETSYRLRTDAAGRAIGGISSGGICAFTVAWQRPDQFSKVLSWVGSFTNIASGPTLREGGHNYPALIRKVPKKPIRVFLQGGENDLDVVHGNWPLANQEMANSLAFAGYDYHFVYGKGFHSTRHGMAILPDSLRWLWREERR
jgi:enterochelin esterase family protein